MKAVRNFYLIYWTCNLRRNYEIYNIFETVFKEMIWGGSRLGTDFGYDIPGDGEGDINGYKKKRRLFYIADWIWRGKNFRQNRDYCICSLKLNMEG